MENSISQFNILAKNATEEMQTINLKNKSKQDLKNVAEQFEAIFVHQMLKQARQSKLAEGMFDSDSQDTFNNMLDMEYSQILSKKNNFGISEALIRQFSSHIQSEEIK